MCRSRILTALVLLTSLGAAPACSSSETSTSTANGPAAPSAQGPVNPGEEEASKEKPKDPSTELVVGVDAESFSSIGLTIDTLEIVAKVDGAVAARDTAKRDAAAGSSLFPRELRLRPPLSNPNADVDIEIVARDPYGSTTNMPPVVKRLAHARFVKGKTKLAYVMLELRCNTMPMAGGFGVSGPTCAEPTTCIGGQCVSSDLGELPDYRTDWAKDPPSACGTGTPVIDLGQGESQTDGLKDGEVIQLERGPQCGHHMWIAVTMKNLSQAGTTTVLSASQPGSSISIPATGFPYAYAADGAGACKLAGLRFQVDGSGAKVADLLGKPLDIKVEATDKAGRKATATKRVQIAPDVKVSPGPSCGS